MIKKMLGFTLEEVLTTLMVIGVVAAMTIPTLMNTTNEQQNKVAYKKAVSVLSQAIQLMNAKETECLVWNDQNLAECFLKSMNGSSVDETGKSTKISGRGNVIVTSDGIAYFFIFMGKRDTHEQRSFEDICGSGFASGDDAFSFGNCLVVVDVNGFSKGAKTFPMMGAIARTEAGLSVSSVGGMSSLASEQIPLIISGRGVRPVYIKGSNGEGLSKGYQWLYGTTTSPYSN